MAEPLAAQPDRVSVPPEDPTGTIRLRGSIGRADVEAVCARLAWTLAAGPSAAIACDLAVITEPALPTVDVLARLALIARRTRREMRLEHASPAILELLALCGLAELLSGGADSGGEASR